MATEEKGVAAPGVRAAVVATRGFKEQVMQQLDDECSSSRDTMSMLTLQPYVIAHLLRVANDGCGDNRSFAKPKTVNAIINTLGLLGIAREIESVDDVPPDQETSLRSMAVVSYTTAKVLAAVAEDGLGKPRAPEFFLVGLVSKVLEEDAELLAGCNDDLIRCFKGEPGWPTIGEASALVESFRAKGAPTDRSLRYFYAVWNESNAHIRAKLDSF